MARRTRIVFIAVSVPLIFVWLCFIRGLLQPRPYDLVGNDNGYPISWYGMLKLGCGSVDDIVDITSFSRSSHIEQIVARCMDQGGPFWTKVSYLIKPRHLQFDNEQTLQAWTLTQRSLVWLEHAQVYLVVLKLVYNRNPKLPNPLFSVLVAEIYDQHHNWQETASIQLTNGGKPQTFPRMIEVPTYTPPRIEWFLGIESFQLVKGSEGKLVVVYSTKWSQTSAKHFAMTIDGTKQWSFECNGHDDDQWTPLTPLSSDSIQFVTSWNPFTVIKCPLDDKDTFGCMVVSTTNHSSSAFSGELPLTQVANNKWLGFGSCQCNDCGCGSHIQRPHMVIISLNNNTGDFVILAMLLPLQLGMDITESNQSDVIEQCGPLGSQITITNIIDYNNHTLMVDYNLGQGLYGGYAYLTFDDLFDSMMMTSSSPFEDILQCGQRLLESFAVAYGDIIEAQMNQYGHLWKLDYQMRKEAEAKENLRKQQVAAAQALAEQIEKETEDRLRLEAEMRWLEAQRYQPPSTVLIV